MSSCSSIIWIKYVIIREKELCNAVFLVNFLDLIRQNFNVPKNGLAMPFRAEGTFPCAYVIFTLKAMHLTPIQLCKELFIAIQSRHINDIAIYLNDFTILILSRQNRFVLHFCRHPMSPFFP